MWSAGYSQCFGFGFWIHPRKTDCPSSAGHNRHLLWLLPLLMLLWVNVHGGFLLAFVLLGLYWPRAAWQWFTLKEDRFEDVRQKATAGKRAQDLALIGVASALATLANPYGWKLHVHILPLSFKPFPDGSHR
jgi:hypothetical protein